MKINNLIIEFDHSEAEALRDLINGFFKMQEQLGCGEGSSRVTLARQLLQILPQEHPPKRPDMYDIPAKECKEDKSLYESAIDEIYAVEDERVMKALKTAGKKASKKKGK
jgi:hypothetical protein